MRLADAVQHSMDYLQHRLQSVSHYRIHSPFVFDFAMNVMLDRRRYPEYERVENVRYKMADDNRAISVNDYGAGSRVQKTNTRKISQIASTSLKPAKYAQLLFRIVKHYKPKNILELGTSLGITTSYLALADPSAKVITLEGSDEIAAIARKNFSDLGISNIELIEGKFEDTLSPTLQKMQQVDLVYIDGNHKLAPTMQYFEEILSFAHNDTIFVIDDIYWSAEMKESWNYIAENQIVTLSIDLFSLGLVFIRKENQYKERFLLSI